MKNTNDRICLIIISLLLLFSNSARSQHPYVTISGLLKDASTGENISFASITIPNTGIGTVSNSDGEFTLKIADSLIAEYFEVSHLSYATTGFKISDASVEDQVFYLVMKPVQIREVTIVPADARGLVQIALGKIRENYSEVPNRMTGFYRESIMQNRDYLSISEAVVEIYKAAYIPLQNDQVRIFKGRKGSDVKKADTLLVELQGGPNVLLMLDIVKNPSLSISFDELDHYIFNIESFVNIDDQLNWVVSFAPSYMDDNLLYEGKLYISQDNMAITRAEFSLDLSDKTKAAQALVKKAPYGLDITPAATSYLVTFKKNEGKHYLNYVRVELKFKCNWKRRLFNKNYLLTSEMAITDRTDKHVERFPRQETFKSSMIFSSEVQTFTDSDFWGANNIIEPEKSIENAIRKLSKKLEN